MSIAQRALEIDCLKKKQREAKLPLFAFLTRLLLPNPQSEIRNLQSSIILHHLVTVTVADIVVFPDPS